MPPKARITEDMIVDAAFILVQEEGLEKINARAIAEKLKCSTQPILYYFKTMEDIRQAVYKRTDQYHSQFLFRDIEKSENPMLSIGLRYILFAKQERELFILLFQTKQFFGDSVAQIIDNEDLVPIFQMLQQAMNISEKQAKEIFTAVFFEVHGMASLIANTKVCMEIEEIEKWLQLSFMGMAGIAKEKGEENEEAI